GLACIELFKSSTKDLIISCPMSPTTGLSSETLAFSAIVPMVSLSPYKLLVITAFVRLIPNFLSVRTHLFFFARHVIIGCIHHFTCEFFFAWLIIMIHFPVAAFAAFTLIFHLFSLVKDKHQYISYFFYFQEIYLHL